jgi:integron integrase
MVNSRKNAHDAYQMNAPLTRIPTRIDLIQQGRQAQALQRSRRSAAPVTIPENLKVIDQFRYLCRARHYSLSTEEVYCMWLRKFILFHNKQHPSVLGGTHVHAFIRYLSVDGQCSASTVRQALSAIILFYRDVLKLELPWIDGLITPKRPTYIPVVFSQREVQDIFKALEGTWRLIAQILYGGGLRLNEALQLRIKDIDFDRQALTIRQAKGAKDRYTCLPVSLVEPLKAHIAKVHQVWTNDVSSGKPGVFMPPALERKLKTAGNEWPWFWVFPSQKLSLDPRAGIFRRHHVYDQSFSRALKLAARQAGINKRVTSHGFRHSFATHMIEAGYDIRTVQELLGHRDVSTTQIYTHVLNKNKHAVISPADRLGL